MIKVEKKLELEKEKSKAEIEKVKLRNNTEGGDEGVRCSATAKQLTYGALDVAPSKMTVIGSSSFDGRQILYHCWHADDALDAMIKPAIKLKSTRIFDYKSRRWR